MAWRNLNSALLQLKFLSTLQRGSAHLVEEMKWQHLTLGTAHRSEAESPSRKSSRNLKSYDSIAEKLERCPQNLQNVRLDLVQRVLFDSFRPSPTSLYESIRAQFHRQPRYWWTDSWIFVGPVCDSLTDEFWVWYNQWGIIISLYQRWANVDFFDNSLDPIDLNNVSYLNRSF